MHQAPKKVCGGGGEGGVGEGRVQDMVPDLQGVTQKTRGKHENP